MNARFLTLSRTENKAISEAERLKSALEFHVPLAPPARERQASRCLNCGVPFCQSNFGCPLNNLIPEWNALLCEGHARQAYERLIKTSCFPEFTSRVCPALCEKACNLACDGAVTNKDNELYIIETAFENGWVTPVIPKARTGKRVAVIGSGPSGLAAADALNKRGHTVTIYERDDAPGGLLMYGIPNMKLDKRVIARRIALMRSEGVEFIFNTCADISIADKYDAAVLAVGARAPRRLNVSGAVYAVDYLSEATRAHMGKRAPSIDAYRKRVIVVGGGDTGNDCVATCLRQKCLSVTQLEMLPKPPVERVSGNPWPEWPRVLKTDYGQQEAIAVQGADPRVYETTVKSYDGARALLVSMRREGGAFAEIPGSERYEPCDLLLVAAGFIGCEPVTARAFRAETDARGNLPARAGDKLFSAGDAHTGQSLVVRAIADGRRAAREADAYLSGK